MDYDIQVAEQAVNSIRNSMGKGKIHKALHKCNAALQKFPEYPMLLKQKGRCLLSLPEKRSEAYEFAKELTQRHSNWEEGFILVALCFLFAGEPESAIISIRQALKIDPHSVEAKVVLCNALYDLGEYKQAMQQIERLEIEEKLTEYDVPFLRDTAILKSRILLVRKELAQARQNLLDCCVRHGSDPTILAELRRYNPECDSKSCTYRVSVCGLVPTSRILAFEPSTFMGTYDVIANSKEEALDYIREIQNLADPSSLSIHSAEKLKGNLSGQHCGVIVAYFSMSFETVAAAA